jgi:LysM repeat protein
MSPCFFVPMSRYIHIHNLDAPKKQRLKIKYCQGFFCKLRGLMFRARIAPDEGLLFVYGRDSRMDTSIHMLFMNFDIAVVWINSSMQVVDKTLAKRWKLAYAPKNAAQYVLEAHPDILGSLKLVTRFNSKMFKQLFVVILTLFLLFAPQQSTSAQDPDGPTYIVQSGDTLWDIASRFNVDLDELMRANDMEDGNLSIGQEIVIPGLEGVSGVLRTETVPYGDNLRSLMRRTQAPREILRRLNRLVSPTELYAGVSLIVPVDAEAAPMMGVSLTSGGTLLEEAVRQNSDIWSLTVLNQLENTSTALPGEILYMPAGNESAQLNANGLPSAFALATVTDLPLVQAAPL